MRVFVVRPFGTKTDSAGKSLDFDRTHRELISPALSELGWSGDTTAEIIDSGNIRDDMFRLLVEADVVIADITIHNANVFYELGIRHALRTRRTFLIRGGPVADSDIFDLKTDRYLWYPVDDPGSKVPNLVDGLRASAISERRTDSPVFQLVPELDESDFLDLQVVPSSLREEIGRARAAGAKGWLRLLADDVHGMRFALAAEHLIGKAQWDVKDYEASLRTWKRVLDKYPNDVAANLAVANLHERLSRNDPLQLVQSDQALERVLSLPSIDVATRAEALALTGRNLKTRWRAQLDTLTTLEERRVHATDAQLRQSYEAYFEAFRCDLNAFYPGLVALQLATILADVANDEAWYDAFDTERDAERYAEDLAEALQNLRGAVSIALQAAPDDGWLDISRADHLFLTHDKPKRVAARYRGAIDSPFHWDAARGQLELFEALGVRAEMAREVLAALGPRGAQDPATPTHLVLFAGHMTDPPGREPARLPASALATVKARIRDVLAPLTEGHRVIALASACPGGDLTFHACCRELGVEAQICLPMPAEAFASTVFGADDASKSAFLDLVRECGGPNPRVRQLVLADHDSGLPRWLRGTDRNPWERGNRWTLALAEAWGADKVTLIALWDGEPSGGNSGGTAYMVELARRSVAVSVQVIPTSA